MPRAIVNEWSRRWAIGLMSSIALALPPVVTAQAAEGLEPSPEISTGRVPHALGVARTFMVAAANPLAAEAGREILRAGGGAVDAAVAVQMVLTLVEPQSSGLGGGAFMVHFDAANRALTSFDGRETAPAAARPDRFLAPDGKPMTMYEAAIGGRAVGVPGTVRLLALAHQRFGKLPWPRLFQRAIALAETGFAVSPRLHGLLAAELYLKHDPRAAAVYYHLDGTALAIGETLRNPALAATLRTLAEKGPDAFYQGAIARDIVATVTGDAGNPGDMTVEDLRAYQVKERPVPCGAYRVYTICGMGPPSSGGIAVIQMLGLLDGQPMPPPGDGKGSDGKGSDGESGEGGNALAIHNFAEASRLAFADRARHVADPDFVAVPTAGLIDPAYIASRARLIAPTEVMKTVEPGDPPARKGAFATPPDGVERGTSHIAIVDANGDGLTMTTTVEDQFGARRMTGGFLLNNELTDFSFTPEIGGRPVANRVEPGKRPRSSMSPTLVFQDGRLIAAVGSAGGSAIINYVAKTLVALLDWRLNAQQAVDFPNFADRTGPVELEKDTVAEAWAPALRALGHQTATVELTSGTQAIVKTPSGWEGGADFRREGVAIGDGE